MLVMVEVAVVKRLDQLSIIMTESSGADGATSIIATLRRNEEVNGSAERMPRETTSNAITLLCMALYPKIPPRYLPIDVDFPHEFVWLRGQQQVYLHISTMKQTVKQPSERSSTRCCSVLERVSI